jgi:hypothetical protein
MSAPDRSFPNGSPVCEYWLTRCEGFTVRAGHRILGEVENVGHYAGGGRADTLVVRKSHRRKRTLATDDVLAVVPARKMLLARRHQHAKPALDRVRHDVEAATPVVAAYVGAVIAALWALTLRIARTLRHEGSRLTRLALAEIHDRNLHHGEEPGIGRAHRRANDYAFAVQQPLGRGRNVGPTRSR